MANKKAIRFQDVHFTSFRGVIADGAVTLQVHATAKFDQVVASQLNVKDAFYDANGSIRDDVRSWSLGYETLGNEIAFGSPKQLELGGKQLPSKDALVLRVLRVSALKVKKEKKHETTNISFVVDMLDDENLMVDFVREIRKQPIDVTVQPAKKEQSEEAKRQLNLYRKGSDEPDESEEAEAEPEEPEED